MGNMHMLTEVGRVSFPWCVGCTIQAIYWCKWCHSLRHTLPRARIVGLSRRSLSWDRGVLGVSKPILQWLAASLIFPLFSKEVLFPKQLGERLIESAS